VRVRLPQLDQAYADIRPVRQLWSREMPIDLTHRCATGLPWLMDPGVGEVRLAYLCQCGRTMVDPQPPAHFDTIARDVLAQTARIQTVLDNVAAEWRAGR